jgi:hypothetical protein
MRPHADGLKISRSRPERIQGQEAKERVQNQQGRLTNLIRQAGDREVWQSCHRRTDYIRCRCRSDERDSRGLGPGPSRETSGWVNPSEPVKVFLPLGAACHDLHEWPHFMRRMVGLPISLRSYYITSTAGVEERSHANARRQSLPAGEVRPWGRSLESYGQNWVKLQGLVDADRLVGDRHNNNLSPALLRLQGSALVSSHASPMRRKYSSRRQHRRRPAMIQPLSCRVREGRARTLGKGGWHWPIVSLLRCRRSPAPWTVSCGIT